MSDDYKVGYQKTPEHTRFREGVSGNPKGRPKGTKNLKTDLREELSERIVVRSGERTVRISKQRAILKGLVVKALKGDVRAAALVIDLIANLLGLDQSQVEANEPLSDDDLELLEGIGRRLLTTASASKKSNDQPEEG